MGNDRYVRILNNFLIRIYIELYLKKGKTIRVNQKEDPYGVMNAGKASHGGTALPNVIQFYKIIFHFHTHCPFFTISTIFPCNIAFSRHCFQCCILPNIRNYFPF